MFKKSLIAFSAFKFCLVCFQGFWITGCNLLCAYIPASFTAELLFFLEDETSAEETNNTTCYYNLFHI